MNCLVRKFFALVYQRHAGRGGEKHAITCFRASNRTLKREVVGVVPTGVEMAEDGLVKLPQTQQKQKKRGRGANRPARRSVAQYVLSSRVVADVMKNARRVILASGVRA